MNILRILVDDVGKELFAGSGPGGSTLAGAGTYALPATPNIDALRTGGCNLTRFYVEQLCSPSRAAMETARHPERTGVTDIIRDDDDMFSSQPPLPESETTLAMVLRDAGWATACFGKWHLGNVNNGGRAHPNRAGFQTYAGNMFNLANDHFHEVNGETFREGYFAWDMTRGASDPNTCRTFHTTQTVNNAKRWITDHWHEPWYCYLSLFGAHAPFINNSGTPPGTLVPPAVNAPPTSLYNTTMWNRAQDNSGSPADTVVTMHAYRAHIEAFDAEIGRLLTYLATLPGGLSDTLILFSSDNGSGTTLLANEVHPTLGAYPSGRGKDSPYETGTYAPLYVKGPGVSAGIRYEKLVSAVDIMPTILELVGLPMPEGVEVDGVSFAAQLAGSSAVVRPFSYSFWAQPMGVGVTRTTQEWAVTGDADGSGDGRYTLISKPDGLEFYDNFPGGTYDPRQTTNLLLSALSAPQQAAFEACVTEKARLDASFP